jgi:hypothetical protein
MKRWLILIVFLLPSCITSYQKVESPRSPAAATSFQTILKDQPVESGVAVATNVALKYTIKSEAERTKVADYIDVYAHAIRTITGSPTPEELTAELNSWIPAKVRMKHPTITAAGISLIVVNYQKHYPSLKGHFSKTIDWLNKTATGLEYGSAAFITKTAADNK